MARSWGKFMDARVFCEDALHLWNPDFRTITASPEDPYVGILRISPLYGRRDAIHQKKLSEDTTEEWFNGCSTVSMDVHVGVAIYCAKGS